MPEYHAWVFYQEDLDQKPLVVPDLDAMQPPYVEAESAEAAAEKILWEHYRGYDEAFDPSQPHERTYVVAIRERRQEACRGLAWQYFSKLYKMALTQHALSLYPATAFRHVDTLEGYVPETVVS